MAGSLAQTSRYLKMRVRIQFLCGFLLVALPVWPAAAQNPVSDEGLYLSFGGGVSDGTVASNSWQYEVLEADLSTSVFDFNSTYGVAATGAVGYSWAPSGYATEFRLELEGSYRRTFLDNVTISNYCSCGSLNAQIVLDADGYLENIAAMVNGYVDLHTGDAKFMPYVGIGVGGVRVTRRDASFGGVPASGKYTHTGAWQVMGGIGYRLTPGIILGIELRRFETFDFYFDGNPSPQRFEQQEILLNFRLVG